MKAVSWEKIPQTDEGEARVLNEAGEWSLLSWKKDADGFCLVFPDKVLSFSFQIIEDECSNKRVQIFRRLSFEEWEEDLSSQKVSGTADAREQSKTSGQIKKLKIRAQMSGKVIRVKVQVGDTVEKNQPLLVMEAMKMENEIFSPISGKITQVDCQEGMSLEAGVALLWIEPN